MLKSSARRWAPLCAFGALIAGFGAAPALAQPVTDEVVVLGRYPDRDANSLSEVVSYRDLDLTTEAGRDILKDRVRAAAHDVCWRLGESGSTSSALLPSCEQQAVDSAREQVRTAYAMASSQLYAVVPVAPPPAGYVAPAGPNPIDEPPPAASGYGEPAAAIEPSPSYSTETITNGAVPDTPQNRAAYGGPISRGGRMTAPAGN
jgi:UrcA family protein